MQLFLNIKQSNKPAVLLDQMLVAYRQESRTIETLDTIEKLARKQFCHPPIRVSEEFSLSLDAAILSLRGWLLAFSAVALLLFTLSNFQSQSNIGFDEVLTYNTEGVSVDPLTLSVEQEYGH